MKKTIKLFWLIAIVAVIGFSFVACDGGDDDSGSGGSGGGGGGSGGISGGTVTYPDGIADADKPTDFSFYFAERISPLSNFINEPASVTISGGNLTIKLGTPKDEYLVVFGNDPSSYDNYDVTVTPSDAKLLIPDAVFSTVDAKYILICMKNTSVGARLVYSDKDVTIKGTLKYRNSNSEAYNVSLKKGWNYLISSKDERTITNTSSVSLPSGFTWTVIKQR